MRRWPIAPVRLIVVTAVTLATLWWVMRVTIGFVLTATNQGAAVGWWPSANAQASLATQLLATQATSPSDLAQAEILARNALRREAVSAKGASTLGLVYALRGRTREALGAIGYSEKLSRRELQAQIWLIEHAVGRGDVDGALLHYNRAMTTSPSSRSLLIPVLVKASDDPAIAGSLARVLGGRPNWWSEFLEKAIPGMQQPASLARLLAALHLRIGDRGERELFTYALNRLVGLGAYQQAFALYSAAKPGAGLAIRDADFEAANDLPPLDWAFGEDAELGAAIQPKPDRSADHAMFLNAGSGRGGVVARQIMRLPPGRYQLSLVAGDIPANQHGQPAIGVQCAGASASIVDLMLTRAGEVSAEMRVPAKGCAAQWLSVAAGPGSDADAPQPWVDSFRIQARRDAS